MYVSIFSTSLNSENIVTFLKEKGSTNSKGNYRPV